MISRRGVGGYLGLEPLSIHGAGKPTGQAFQSARAALYALLSTTSFRQVWLPTYCCSALKEAVSAIGATLRAYSLTPSMGAPPDLPLAPDDVVLCINYFGLGDEEVRRSICAFGSNRVIVDNAQSLFSPPEPVVGTIYSPRKFVGIPDGGYLVTRHAPYISARRDTGSVHRCTHLLLRHLAGAEAGYRYFRAAEESLSDPSPLAMSRLTAGLIKFIDFDHVAKRRTENFRLYDRALRPLNRMSLPRNPSAAPLCYPFVSPVPDLRQRLIAQKIFTPSYWPDSPFARDGGSGTAEYLLPLPLDQRYSLSEIERIIEKVLQLVGHR